jgi:maltose O-acetyltransferase
VVTKDIPANSVAVGNPCKVLRAVNENDMKYYYKDRAITREDLDEEARLR